MKSVKQNRLGENHQCLDINGQLTQNTRKIRKVSLSVLEKMSYYRVRDFRKATMERVQFTVHYPTDHVLIELECAGTSNVRN